MKEVKRKQNGKSMFVKIGGEDNGIYKRGKEDNGNSEGI
jgi:hypothetical protein